MASRLLSRLQRHGRVGFKFAYYVAVGVTALAFVRDNVYEVTGVDGRSMAPTLSPRFNDTGEKDQLLFNRRVAPPTLLRGDIVSFWSPNNPEQISVKRVVALPGDTVVPRARYPFATVMVPYNHIWVEGDDRRHTVDSNDYGPISMGLVNGRAKYIVWPPSRMGKIPEPDIGSKCYSKVIPAKAPLKPPPEFDE